MIHFFEEKTLGIGPVPRQMQGKILPLSRCEHVVSGQKPFDDDGRSAGPVALVNEILIWQKLTEHARQAGDSRQVISSERGMPGELLDKNVAWSHSDCRI